MSGGFRGVKDMDEAKLEVGIVTPARPTANEPAQPADVEFIKILKSRRAHPDNDVPIDVPVFSISNTPICHKGNLTLVEAQAKAGKTAYLEACLASTFSLPGADCLGWQSSNPTGSAVLHFDTEQSKADHHAFIKRVHRRSQAAKYPDWLDSYTMVGLTIFEIIKAITIALERGRQEHGGIHSLIIDGAGDLVPCVNDTLASKEIVTWLMMIAAKYDIPVIVVLHLNPISSRGQIAKARGHLGTEIYRKCEHTLRLDKNADGITSVTSLTPRKAALLPDAAPCFRWSDKSAMHISTERPKSAAAAKDLELRELAAGVFRESGGVHVCYSDLVKRIKTATGRTADSTAEGRIQKMLEKAIISKHEKGYLLA